jgi:putative addiction module killer protein
MGYNRVMNTITRTAEFNEWLVNLGDLKARAKIVVRIRNAELGNLGNYRVLEDGVRDED